MNMIYLDNAATTRLFPEAYETMKPYLMEEYANASGMYRFASMSKQAIEKARFQIASLIHAQPEEIYFTSGGTESDNWAVFSAAENGNRHFVTTKMEHHAILHSFEYLEKNGFRVTYLSPTKEGYVTKEQLEKSIRPETGLVSVMYANNEIGTIQPVAELGEVAENAGILFHVDAVQAVGHVPIDVEKEKITYLSGSGHKFGGPKGIGFLYVRKDAPIHSMIYGGAQERGLRAGTYSTASIVGMGKAAEISNQIMEQENQRLKKMQEYMIGRALQEIPDTALNGGTSPRLKNNVSLYFKGVESESLLILLDRAGICASGGSACASGSLQPSHVILSLGESNERAKSTIRFTMGIDTTKAQLDYTIEALKKSVSQLRTLSN